jgi:hypothetical protein
MNIIQKETIHILDNGKLKIKEFNSYIHFVYNDHDEYERIIPKYFLENILEDEDITLEDFIEMEPFTRTLNSVSSISVFLYYYFQGEYNDNVEKDCLIIPLHTQENIHWE